MAEGDSSPTGGLGDLFSRLQEAREDLEAQAEAIEQTIVEGHAAGGAVVIRLTGSLEAKSVHIDPSIVDPADPSLLEDAVLAALHDVLGRIVELRTSVQAPDDPAFAANLDLGGLLAGVDLEGLMGNLGLGVDLGAFAGIGELGESEGDDEYGEDQVDGSADDEPQA
ncbi:MAG: YbaB/EbfC family nucleoid-associated protein [Acidimicrobiales bacterium]|jgi:DNA-binding YbaB/EbfC family protein